MLDIRDVVKLPHYRIGDQKAICPQCSHTRKKKYVKCLSVTIDATGWVINCWHCAFTTGSGNPPKEGTRPRPIRKSWAEEWSKRQER